MSITKCMKIKDMLEKEKSKHGIGDAAFQRVRSTKYPAMRDDGRKRLHPAR
jgi:hypothetical protein